MLSQHNRQYSYRSICHRLTCFMQISHRPLALHHRLIKSPLPITAYLKSPQDTQLFLEVLKAFHFHNIMVQQSILCTENHCGTHQVWVIMEEKKQQKNRPDKQQENNWWIFLSFGFRQRIRLSSPWWIRASSWRGQLLVQSPLTEQWEIMHIYMNMHIKTHSMRLNIDYKTRTACFLHLDCKIQ